MKIIGLLYIIVIHYSCSKLNKLSKDDYSWLPYKGHEKLVFKSDSGLSDTIHLYKKDTLIAYPEPLSLSGIRYEVVTVVTGKKGKSGEWEPGYEFLEIRKGKDKKADINLRIEEESAYFFMSRGVKLQEIIEKEPVVMQTDLRTYEDVYVFEQDKIPERRMGNKRNVSRVYWSRTGGLVGFENFNGTSWKLAGIISE